MKEASLSSTDTTGFLHKIRHIYLNGMQRIWNKGRGHTIWYRQYRLRSHQCLIQCLFPLLLGWETVWIWKEEIEGKLALSLFVMYYALVSVRRKTLTYSSVFLQWIEGMRSRFGREVIALRILSVVRLMKAIHHIQDSVRLSRIQ